MMRAWRKFWRRTLGMKPPMRFDGPAIVDMVRDGMSFEEALRRRGLENEEFRRAWRAGEI